MEDTLWGNLLHPVQLTGSGRPILQAGEVECSILDAVDLEMEEDPVYPILKAGLAILTTHKIIWVDEKSRRAGAIPLASLTQVFPPKKSIKSMLAKPRLRLQSWVSSDGKIAALGVTRATRSVVITLILRGQSLPDSFRGRLCELLRSREWETDVQQVNLSKQPIGQMGSYADANSIEEGSGSSRLKASMAGLSGILRKEQEEWEATDKSLQEAFQGLNALLLADFVQIPLERAGGMIALIDVYCMFNRARGTELISPEDLLQACAIWEKIDVPVMFRQFDSGVIVIQSKAKNDDEVFARIKDLVVKTEALQTGVGASEAARTLGVAPALAKEYLLAAESKGFLCRDDGPDGLRFYINFFKEINPNNIFL